MPLPPIIVCVALLTGLGIFSLPSQGEDNRDRQTVMPTESDALLLNPGMGWVVYGEANSFDDKTLAYASIGYQRFQWETLQPAEDEFNWEPVERFLTAWQRRGKQAAFGVMAANSHSPVPFVTPRWVFDAGAEYKEAEITDNVHGRTGIKVVPDFDHQVFLEKLAGFLKAFSQRYDGDPRIAFLDIRSYGNWGEAHMSHLGQYPLISDAMFRRHVELHRAAFQHTRLILPLNDDLRQYRSVAAWAVEHGIGVRRDGIMGNSDGSETAIAHGKEPGVFEWYQNYDYTRRQGWWDGTSTQKGFGYPLAGCIERGHPSYVQMGYWGGKNVAEFLAAERPLVDRLSNRIGYRLVLTAVALPKTITPGMPSTIAMSIANRGVAYVLVPCHLALGLMDDHGKVVARAWAEGANPKAWAPDTTITQTIQATFEAIPAGTYRICLGLFTDKDAPSPAIALAIDGGTEARWYPLAHITVP